MKHAIAAERFADNKNGTVTYTQTGLIWATQDNESDINWYSAKSYCEGYRNAVAAGGCRRKMSSRGCIHPGCVHGEVMPSNLPEIWYGHQKKEQVYTAVKMVATYIS